MATALLCTIILTRLGRSPRFAGAAFTTFPYSLVLTVAVSVPVWVTVTFITRAVDRDHRIRVYERVRPGGFGWKAVAAGLPGFESDVVGRIVLAKVIAGLIMLNSTLIGTGKIILGSRPEGFMLLGLAAISGAVLYLFMRSGKS